MDNKDLLSGDNKDLHFANDPFDGHSQFPQTDAGKLQREVDSLDDFERLEHETVMSHQMKNETMKFLDNLRESSESPPRVASGEMHQEINTGVEPMLNAAVKVMEDSLLDPHPSEKSSVFSEKVRDPKMDSNLLEMGDAFDNKNEEKLESFLSDFTTPVVPPHSDTSAGDKNIDNHQLIDEYLTSHPITIPKEMIDNTKPGGVESFDEKFRDFSDFETPEVDERLAKLIRDDPSLSYAQLDMPQGRGYEKVTYEDVRDDSPQPPLPTRDYFDIEEENNFSTPLVPEKQPVDKKKEQIFEAPVKPVEKPPPPPVAEEKKEIKKPEPSAPVEQPKALVEDKKQEVKKDVKKEAPMEAKPKAAVIEAEAMFCKMGLGKSLQNLYSSGCLFPEELSLNR